MNLYELKQPLQSKEPTHFITAPAHQALTVPHTSLPFGLWRKKNNRSIFWATEHKMGLACTGSLHTEGKHVQTGAGSLHPLGEPALETQRTTLGALLESTLVYVSGFY